MYDQFILSANVAMAIAATITTKYILILLYGDPFFTFRENIGISLTIRRASTTDAIGISIVSWSIRAKVVTPWSAANISDPHQSAQAGVARPRKFSLCLSSTLNFASLRAAKTAKMRGIYATKPVTPPSTSLLCIIIAGRRPKLMQSARESSSLPIGEYALRSLAAKPSKKSQTAAASIR